LNHYLGDIELLYEAKMDSDGDDCAREAERVAMRMNEFGQRNARRRRQTSADDETDPIFNFVTVATTIDSTDTDTNTGGGAAYFTMSYSILFAAMLLALFMY